MYRLFVLRGAHSELINVLSDLLVGYLPDTGLGSAFVLSRRKARAAGDVLQHALEKQLHTRAGGNDMMSLRNAIFYKLFWEVHALVQCCYTIDFTTSIFCRLGSFNIVS